MATPPDDMQDIEKRSGSAFKPLDDDDVLLLLIEGWVRGILSGAALLLSLSQEYRRLCKRR